MNPIEKERWRFISLSRLGTFAYVWVIPTRSDYRTSENMAFLRTPDHAWTSLITRNVKREALVGENIVPFIYLDPLIDIHAHGSLVAHLKTRIVSLLRILGIIKSRIDQTSSEVLSRVLAAVLFQHPFLN